MSRQALLDALIDRALEAYEMRLFNAAWLLLRLAMNVNRRLEQDGGRPNRDRETVGERV